MNAFRTPVVCLSAAVLFLAVSLAGQQPHSVASSTQNVSSASNAMAPIEDQGARLNPNKIALLHWYLGNTVTRFKVGSQPYGLCFDGANIWVTNFFSSTVTKMRIGDGKLLGTYPVGANPNGVVFDGANIWVANQNTDSVTKLRASDGKLVGTYPIGNAPGLMGFDGANVWVANFGSNTVSKL